MTAADLLRHHATLRLAAGGYHFKAILDAFEMGKIPEASHPEVQTYLPVLRDQLRQEAVPDTDEIVLRYALTVPGSQRGIDPPIEVLSANRGGLSKNRLREATSAVKYLRKGLLLARMLTGNQGPELLPLIKESVGILAQRQHDSIPLLDHYLALDPKEAAILLGKALELSAQEDKEIRELGDEILSYLAGTREEGLGSATDALAARGEFPSPHLFRGASDQTVQSILSFLENPGGQHRNLSLLSLAWVRSDAAASAFRSWQSSPPAWAKDLYLPPAKYLHEAALAMDATGNLIELASGPCHLLTKDPDPALTIAVPCLQPAGEACPGCANPLSWLFDFSGIPDRFLPWNPAEIPRKILNCDCCSCYSPFFSRYAPDGSASCQPATVFEEPKEACGLNPATLFLSTTALPTFVSAISYAMEYAVVLGGVPAWVQDAEYPSCPDCKTVMRFLGYFANGWVQEEGVQYAFFCAACRVAAVTYQQS